MKRTWKVPLCLLMVTALAAGLARITPAATQAPKAGALAASETGHEHDHGNDEGSDLDETVEELFASRCEHGVAAHTCAECRYEVGVVKVPQDLISEGLVQVGAVGRRPFGMQVQLTGEVRFDESRIAHLGPRLSGVVGRVMVDLGKKVSSGTPLMAIDSAELAEAEAAYLQAAAEHRLAQAALERKRVLHEAQISSEREFLEAEQELEASAIQSNAERQKLLRLGLTETEISQLEQGGIKGATGHYLLKAPFDGEVLELHAVRGERVDPGAQLLLFGDVGTVWVWADVYEDDLAAVASAARSSRLPAEVQVRAWPGVTFNGSLDFVGRTMDESTRTVKARIAVRNPGGRLRPGMFAAVELAIGVGDEGTAVPSTAILADEGRDFVFVHHADDYFVRRLVHTGRRDGEWVEVVEGVEPGQTIAVAGGFLLKSDVLRSKMGAGCAD